MGTPGSQRGAPLRVTPPPQDKGVGSCSPEGLSGHWNPWVPPACPAPGRSHQKALGKGGAGTGRGKSGRTAEKREKPRGCGWGPAMILLCFPVFISAQVFSELSQLASGKMGQTCVLCMVTLPEGASSQHCHQGGGWPETPVGSCHHHRGGVPRPLAPLPSTPTSNSNLAKRN